MRVGEVFGYAVEDQSDLAWKVRKAKLCPFRSTPCTKTSKTDPMGICSLTDGVAAASLCPVRFLEDRRIFRDASRIAFGSGASFAIFPEIRILNIPGLTLEARDKKIGKVDFLLGKIVDGKVVDFAALEIQAAYFSGRSLRPAFDEFIQSRSFSGINVDRRPDFRSCAQKRLIPQLQLKVPVFRRWGKKFFVVIDRAFFHSLPTFPSTSASNGELTWLAYPFAIDGDAYHLGDPDIVHSAWEDVQTSLREGKPPEPDEIMAELQRKLMGPETIRPGVFIC